MESNDGAVVFVYMTAGSPEEADRLGRTLVEERLAACVNILPEMRSVYRWQGAVETAAEVVLIAKTRADRFEALAARVRTLHSYATPCIVELPLGRGDAPYLDWLVRESAPEGEATP
ncbi:divalent-cation tolerance protein CutA [Rhodocista pekingensis]|uniref:Divalent-cation tolerance protein CutA n=1 Tax=Rhodocista pekingensis TaxID=201185 RepID=A0ABW2KS21_9PROT